MLQQWPTHKAACAFRRGRDATIHALCTLNIEKVKYGHVRDASPELSTEWRLVTQVENEKSVTNMHHDEHLTAPLLLPESV